MSKLLAKFEASRLPKNVMKLIKGGEDGNGGYWRFGTSSMGSGGSPAFVWNPADGASLDGFVDGGGGDGNYFSTSGWCCQNSNGNVWVYKTNDALLAAAGKPNGPTGSDIQCTSGTYCP